MRCKKSDGTYTTVSWRFFYVNCSRLNIQCNSYSGAYLPAVTVCSQGFF